VPEIICFQIPPDEVLEKRSGWTHLGKSTYSAVRANVVLVKKRELKTVKGPSFIDLDLPAASEYKYEKKKAKVIKHTESIQKSIQQTMTAKLSEEVAQKIASEIGATGVVPSAKLSSEISVKSGVELTDAVQQGLTFTKSYEVENSEEITQSVTFKSSPDGAQRSMALHFFLGLWPWRWDFYLQRVEHLKLQYKRHWLWPDVRKTISITPAEPKLPLFRVRFYEPQNDVSITEHDHVPDIEHEGTEVTIESVTDPMPNTRCPNGTSMEELARLAFPVTRQERKISARVAPGPSKARAASRRRMQAKRQRGRGTRTSRKPVLRKTRPAARAPRRAKFGRAKKKR